MFLHHNQMMINLSYYCKVDDYYETLKDHKSYNV